MKYRKKPVVIEAIRWDGEKLEELNALAGPENSDKVLVTPGPMGWVSIHTLEGVMRANVGDWIIRGVKGELYPCKADIFEATYEETCKAAVDWRGLDGDGISDPTRRQLLEAVCPTETPTADDMAWAKRAAVESPAREPGAGA